MKPPANMNKVLRQIIPKHQRFRASLEPTGLGKYRVLRIVTPAWKSLPRFERILKVQTAIDSHLPEKQTNKILRVSVLTAEEFRRLRGDIYPLRHGPRRRTGNGK